MEIQSVQEAVQHLFGVFQFTSTLMMSPASKRLDDYWAIITPYTLKLAKKTKQFKHEYELDLKHMSIMLNGRQVDASHLKDIHKIFENLIKQVKQNKAMIYQKGGKV
jgi:phage gp36-like protein